MKDLTPAMRQYLEIKASNPGAILFFRMGDFYEMFFEDARAASGILGIALTSRDKNKEIPMCGVPFHAAKSYISKLIKEGLSVAVCEQVSDPDAKGIINRAVVKVITPGCVLEDLDPKSNNYIASVWKGDTWGLASMDASTGEFRLTQLPDVSAALDELRRIRPAEVLATEELTATLSINAGWKLTRVEKYDFDLKESTRLLCANFGTASLDGFGLVGLDDGVRSAGAVFKYVSDTQRSVLAHVKKCVPYSGLDYLAIDGSTARNLEITANIRNGGREGTLLSLLDRTKTSMGARRLKDWLLYPLKDVRSIKSRIEAVSVFFEDRSIRGKTRELLSTVNDIERLIGRINLGAANPRDLASLK